MALTTCELHLVGKPYCVIYSSLLIDVSTPSARTRAFLSITISHITQLLGCKNNNDYRRRNR